MAMVAPLAVDAASPADEAFVYLLFFSPLLLLLAAVAGLLAWRRYSALRLSLALIFFLPAALALARMINA